MIPVAKFADGRNHERGVRRGDIQDFRDQGYDTRFDIVGAGPAGAGGARIGLAGSGPGGCGRDG